MVTPLPGEPTQPARQTPTDVLEVWFAGCHQDVGGGNQFDANQTTLADITLRWMIREIVKSQCGIVFGNSALTKAGIPTDSFPIAKDLLTVVASASKKEETDDQTSTHVSVLQGLHSKYRSRISEGEQRHRSEG
jgi:hypothetical protein